MPKTAFIAVNIQEDHPVGGSGANPDVVLDAIESHIGTDVWIAARELNPSNSLRFASYGGRWPTYCVKGTPGAKLVPRISKLANFITTTHGYSAFEGGTLRPLKTMEDILGEEDVETVFVGGYYFDEQVAQTAFDANALGYETIVDASASPCFRDGEFGRIRHKLEHAGVKVVP